MNKKIFSTAVVFTMALVFFASCGARNKCTLTTDEGVVINGVRWATRNVDAPGTFAPYPESPGMLFQWNRKKGWNATDREVEGWDSTPAEGTKWYAENDPCPQGWRVPTFEEFQYLRHTDNEWTIQNGVEGRLFGTYPYQIFFPVTSWRQGWDGVLGYAGANATLYWGSTRGVIFHSVLGVGNACGDWRNTASAVRCVAK